MNPDLLTRDALLEFAQRRRDGFEWELRNLVGIPTISAEPDRRGEMERCAEYARDMFHRYGGCAEVLETDGHPMVLGRLGQTPGFPTVTVYNHLDVQPANEPEWTTEPFQMVTEGELYRGRGTTDDKGPALAAFYGAIAAQEAGVPLNIHFLWEMEEEIGSPHFRGGLERHLNKLLTDSIVVSDTVWTAQGKPSTPAGLRGILTFFLRLETADHDTHSGVVGGAARNPVGELMEAFCDLVDPSTGKVKVPGFYDEVEKPSKQELQDWLEAGFTVEDFKRDNGLRRLRTEDPLKVMKRTWARPTLEVHGLSGGYQGPGVKAVVPPRAELKLSCRLVPGMDGERTFERIRSFLAKRFPDIEIVKGHYGPAFKGHTTGPYAEAIRDAYAFAFGQSCCFTRQGGTIGAVKAMEEVLGAEVYFLGLSLPSHGYHGPNENFDWAQAGGGMAAFARYFETVSGIGA